MRLQDVPTERLQQTQATMRENGYGHTVQFYQYFTPAANVMDQTPFLDPLTTNLEDIENELNRRLNT